MICELKVVEGPAIGFEYALGDGERKTIGRQENADFCVASDQHLSRIHAVVEWVESEFRLRDLGSRNGTFVNTSRINNVELKSGDRIKVGNSILSVSVENETDTKDLPVSVGNDDSAAYAAPLRILNDDELTFIDDATEAYRMSRAERDDLFRGGKQEKEIKKSRESEFQAKETLLRFAPRFVGEFETDEDSLLWTQKAPGSKQQAEKLLDLLQASNVEQRLSLIVNRSQLDAQLLQTDTSLLSFCKERALTEALSLLHSDRPSDVLDFYRLCLTKDAAICVATNGPLSDIWLRDAIDSLSYPSLLSGVVQQSSRRAAQLVHGATMVLFEANSDGQMCMIHKA